MRLFNQSYTRPVHLKEEIQQLLQSGLGQLLDEGLITEEQIPVPKIERTRDKSHGDFSANTAMVLAKPIGQPPRVIAEKLIAAIPESPIVEKIEIAGPGFINFFLNTTVQHSVIKNIIDQREQFGRSQSGNGTKILIEYVSANPTGPLHVGHGRGAAYGATVANLLESVGYQVDREYYVNDAGRQMDILAASVYLRYLQCCDIEITFPEQCYQGDYILTIAKGLHQQHDENWVISLPSIDFSTNPEQALDELIRIIKQQLADHYDELHAAGLDSILGEIKQDLKEFGVVFDHWYSERSLDDEDKVSVAIDKLKQNQQVYEKDGAQWFRSEALGDEKDRVIVRDNGVMTYFASDIAYHDEKFQRGYDRIIDIWGADHHGYIARVRAALQALNHDPDKLSVLLVQFVSLFRGKEKMQMSTRSGQFVTLRELREEVGCDATRFFYVMRKSEQHLDFDLELATASTKDNPVYYIQYAHARIARLLEKMSETEQSFQIEQSLQYLPELTSEKEDQLISRLSAYADTLNSAAEHYEPHLLAYYLKDLANDFHTFYDTYRIMDQAEPVKYARIALCYAVKQVINNGLSLLGVSAPERM